MNGHTPYFLVDPLSGFVGIFIIFFTLLTAVYSFGYLPKEQRSFRYTSYILMTALCSMGAVYANNLIVFMVFWGFLGLLLYLLVGLGDRERASATAKKAFIIIGGTDALMLLGVAIIWNTQRTMWMEEIFIPLTSKSAILAYLCLAAGALAKAGAMPFHTWVPDTAEDAPTPVTAFLPASLDKLLGIYFLTRLSLDLFEMTPGMNTVLMAVGSITIIAAVMMALIQHDFKRLLGYHAVSQVGYMVLGIGTGTFLGAVGGLFHMLNHAIYKSCLFLSGGAVEKETGTTHLDDLGGLVKYMPITFTTFLIASFAISGLPPFNGFASKWMIYQGILQSGGNGTPLWIVWLMAAVFGSALTLASFMKLIHAIFLGQPASGKKVKEAGPAVWLPPAILAALCLLFGIAYQLPLRLFILPCLEGAPADTGIWNAGLATVLVIAGMVIGVGLYLLGTMTKARRTEIFVGGERVEEVPEMRVSGTGFYNTIENMKFLRPIYRMAKNRSFDLYETGSRLTFSVNRLLSRLHSGMLTTYLAWCLLGMVVLFYILAVK